MDVPVSSMNEPTRREVERLYDLLCTAQLNARYYGCRIGKIGNQHLATQVIPALASVTALAGFLSDAFDWGKALWSLFVVLSAIVTAITPLLGLGQKLQRVETLHSLYLHVFHLCEALLLDIERDGILTQEQVGRSRLLRDVYARIGPLDETSVDASLCKQFRLEVKRALPPEMFGLPSNPSSVDSVAKVHPG
jgi:hypothetical protein